MIKAVLIDAEEKQLTDRAVKIWLDGLQDLAYDVEDILDEFGTEVLRRKLMADPQASRTSKVSSLIPSCFTCLSLSAIKFDMRMGSKVKDITSRLNEICMRRKKLGLKEIAGRTSVAAWERPPSTSTQVEPAIFGRDEDKAIILKMVIRAKQIGDANFSVIPIVGMGGIGKTTLAGEVYNDKAVEDYKPKGWVCVSDDSDVLRISKAILESMTLSSCNLNSLDSVQIKLIEAIAKKKFILVLDDVWKMNYRLWEVLKAPFMAGAPGSMIIVTTRNMEIASIVAGPEKYYELKILSDDHCWSLFQRHAFQSKLNDARVNLELILKKVIENCKGLPLAAKTLGGLLHSNTMDKWEGILNSKIWDFSDVESDILPVLKLSYYYFPSHLKRCFSYCAIISKDYEFEEQEIVLLWMAESLIEQPENGKQLEDVACEYFRDLLSRSIFQQSSTNSSKFVMHDLVNDLAQWVSGDTSFRLEDEYRNKLQPKRLGRARHSSFTPNYFDCNSKFEDFFKVEHLRTFLPIQPIHQQLYSDCYISYTVLSDLVPKLKKLRVLSLRDYCITELPNSIGRLRHLKYLNLSDTRIKSLPESTSSLLNLQILILRSCSHLLMLPSNMRHLIHLQYLDISGSALIKEMPIGMKELKPLLRLSNFVVGKETGSSLTDLKYLKSLRGKLYISSLENASSIQDPRELILSDKEDLEVLLLEWALQYADALRLRWWVEFDETRNEVSENNVINMLQPHRNLKELTITGYGGNGFPSWLGHPSFSKMVILRLASCENCTSLPPLGLLVSLKTLYIARMNKLKSISFEIYGEGCLKPFQSLETLYFEDMKEWEEWEPERENEHVEVFTCLQELSILRCPKLSGRLPDHLPSLEKLMICDCEEFVISSSGLPKLHKFVIDGSDQLWWTSPTDPESLKYVYLSNVSVFGYWLRQGFRTVEALEIVDCQSFLYSWQMETLRLQIEENEELLNLMEMGTFQEKPPQVLPGAFNSLTALHSGSCNALTSLPIEFQRLEGLESLKIKDCNSLEYITRGQPFPSLKRLHIESCWKLKYLFDDKRVDDNTGSSSSSSSVMHKDNISETITFILEYLHVEACPSLLGLSTTGQLPATLTDLRILNCSNLAILSSAGQLPRALTYLRIWNCSNLMTLALRGPLPEPLNFLQIRYCPWLESIAWRFDNNKSLEGINIESCARRENIIERVHSLRVENVLGTTELADARSWLTRVQQIFDVIRCIDDERDSFAIFLLEGGANYL